MGFKFPRSSETVESETTFGKTPSAGTKRSYSRGDHTHGTPSLVTNRLVAGIGYVSSLYNAAEREVTTVETLYAWVGYGKSAQTVDFWLVPTAVFGYRSAQASNVTLYAYIMSSIDGGYTWTRRTTEYPILVTANEPLRYFTMPIVCATLAQLAWWAASRTEASLRLGLYMRTLNLNCYIRDTHIGFHIIRREDIT